MNPSFQLCVFAYNLENTIQQSLKSLIDSCGQYRPDIYVMVNGCRDHTYQQVNKLAQIYSSIIPVEIQLGDKSNAWNTFVHQYYDGYSIAVFADGDLTFEQNAVANIVDYFQLNQHYHAVSSFPCLKGRSAKSWRAALLKEHQFTGNLYLLAPEFLKNIIAQKVYLPTGLIGDDSMLGFLSATNLCSGIDTPIDNIGVCTNAIFNYEPLNPTSLKDIKLYLRRRVRYSKRHMQQSNIVPQLKRYGLKAMPEYAAQIDRLHIRWLSSNVIFDLLAAWSIRQERSRS
ncbi:glycosyltransferase [Vibrio sp. CAIM 722]|uniref:Glycosyltransferase n=1 Tax=Vibrio eleionomae TaxID=2653505 RepID=A0A7X4RWN0_9VIBR|nr:glycosyltransferase family A protein [Vibrio eleionomae]MZI95545.1 glycosyltransferase [Vibrio eleionomae]